MIFAMSARPSKLQDAEGSPIPSITGEEMRRTVIMVRRDLTEIKTALMGNDLGTTGLVPRMASIETKIHEKASVTSVNVLSARVDKHEQKFIVWGAYITAITTGLGIFAKLFHFI